MTMLDSVFPLTVITHAVIVGFAAAVHGTIGIGFPMIATPLLALVTDVRTAILLLLLPTVILNVANILKGGRWTHSIAVFWPLAVYGMIGSLVGTRLLIYLNDDRCVDSVGPLGRIGAGGDGARHAHPRPDPHRGLSTRAALAAGGAGRHADGAVLPKMMGRQGSGVNRIPVERGQRIAIKEKDKSTNNS